MTKSIHIVNCFMYSLDISNCEMVLAFDISYCYILHNYAIWQWESFGFTNNNSLGFYLTYEKVPWEGKKLCSCQWKGHCIGEQGSRLLERPLPGPPKLVSKREQRTSPESQGSLGSAWTARSWRSSKRDTPLLLDIENNWRKVIQYSLRRQ